MNEPTTPPTTQATSPLKHRPTNPSTTNTHTTPPPPSLPLFYTNLAFWQAEMAVLKEYKSGCIPPCRIASTSFTAVFHSPPASHA